MLSFIFQFIFFRIIYRYSAAAKIEKKFKRATKVCGVLKVLRAISSLAFKAFTASKAFTAFF
jgi:hypothetical protein